MPSQQFSMRALAATLFATSVSAHMMMSLPVPYGKSTLNNSPLVADGSDFPCKQRSGVYDAEGASNVMAVGSTNTLSFIGTAVHGGGSCQVSLTTDLQPTKDSKWMVIKSLEGGCPADVPGNLDTGGATTPDPTEFQYTIPQGIAPGDYTIAWSWVNKVGNREFYMNCGPATITAPARKRYAPNAITSPNTKRQTTFPDLFVANLAGVSNSCTTTENVDIEYPDPGSDVTKSPDGAFGPPVGCAGGDGAAAASSPTATAAAGSASSAAASSSGGVFATGAASLSSAPAAATETVSPVPAAASSVPASVASAAPAAATSSSTTTPATSGAVVAGAACTPEGEWACSADGTSYQRCASGVWSVSMQMAAGTSCTPGVSDTLTENVTSAKLKRHSMHARRGHQAYARLS